MLYTKKCPKCQKTNIVRIDDVKASFSNSIPAGPLFKTANISRYLCMDCGYIEQWFEPKDLEKYKNKW